MNKSFTSKKKKHLKIEKTNITERCASFFRTVVLLKMQSSQQLYDGRHQQTQPREKTEVRRSRYRSKGLGDAFS